MAIPEVTVVVVFKQRLTLKRDQAQHQGERKNPGRWGA